VGRAGEMVGMPLKRKPRLNTNKALSAKALRRIIQIASIGGDGEVPMIGWVGLSAVGGWKFVWVLLIAMLLPVSFGESPG